MTTDNIKLPPLPEGNVAHLIAAQAAEIEALRAEVDELLTALRNALPVLEFEVETRGSNDLLYEIPAGPVLDAARAAIARAEGRSDVSETRTDLWNPFGNDDMRHMESADVTGGATDMVDNAPAGGSQ